GFDPVRDPSNDAPAFLRNRVRHELLPLCAQVAGRDPVPLLARQAGGLRDGGALLDSLAPDLLPDPNLARGRGGGGTAGRLRVEPARRSGSVTPVTLDESAAGVPSWAAVDVGPALVDA